MNVLLIGRGGREHALAHKLVTSPHCSELKAISGNPGIAQLGECIDLPLSETDTIVRIAERHDLVVIGPEKPLALGLADALREAGVPTFGPSKQAARIESDKAFARNLMKRCRVAQPRFAVFKRIADVEHFLAQPICFPTPGVVVKANGLANGKGVEVCSTNQEALTVARSLMIERRFGAAGATLLLEEKLDGRELSLFVLTDGRAAIPLLSARDYKRAYKDDQGPNTGGMGAYAAVPWFTPELLDLVMRNTVYPVIDELAEDGSPFRGLLYFGLILCPREGHGVTPKVIEINARFGDPETQAVLALLESDLLPLLSQAATGHLDPTTSLVWKDQVAVTVVVASPGYPNETLTGAPVTGLEAAAAEKDVTVFHSGTALRRGKVTTNGGRAFSVTATGSDFKEAAGSAYAAAEKIDFPGRWYRNDIAADVTDLARK